MKISQQPTPATILTILLGTTITFRMVNTLQRAGDILRRQRRRLRRFGRMVARHIHRATQLAVNLHAQRQAYLPAGNAHPLPARACAPAIPCAPARSQHSSVKCGTKGLSNCNSTSTPCRFNSPASPSESAQCVGKLAATRHGLVEMKLGQVLAHAINGLVHYAKQGLILRASPLLAGAPATSSCTKPPQFVQITPRPLHARSGPFQIPLRRGIGHHEQPRGICPIALDNRPRVHHVALGLAHFLDAPGLLTGSPLCACTQARARAFPPLRETASARPPP